MPQVSKGDRAVITARIPVSYDRKLRHWVDTTGETRTDLIERLIRNFLDSHEPEQQSGQEELPLKKTA
jgi:metal-responsive CopG/Arc/MetJ family transcriptional regulator